MNNENTFQRSTKVTELLRDMPRKLILYSFVVLATIACMLILLLSFIPEVRDSMLGVLLQ